MLVPVRHRLTLAATLSAALFSHSALANQPQIYGLHEHVLLNELDLALPAKLDTGAETASLSAKNIHVFKRDGGEWVRFQLGIQPAEKAPIIEKPLTRMSYIKRRADDRQPGDNALYSERPVVKMEICVGIALKNKGVDGHLFEKAPALRDVSQVGKRKRQEQGHGGGSTLLSAV